MTRKAREKYVILATLLIPFLLFLGLWRIWPQICGNSPIAFYGRVVDDKGAGVPNVRVTFDILYSLAPSIGSRDENTRHETVVTDASGNFELVRVVGYSVRVAVVEFHGKKIGLAGVNLKPDEDPGYGVQMDDESSRRKLPETPAKRASYQIVELK